MERIDAYGAVAVMPVPGATGATAGFFTEGDPGTGTPATRVSADWLNNIQEELAGVIEEMGLTLDKADPTQLLAAIRLLTGVPSNPDPVTTTDATQTDLVSVALAEGDMVMVEASVVGRKSDGSAFYAGRITATFYRNTGGNVTQLGGASLTDEVNDSSWGGLDAVADTANQTGDIRCTGLAGTTIKWAPIVRVTRVSA